MTKKNNILKQAAAYPHIVWAVLFIIAPLLFVAYYAFTNTNEDGKPCNTRIP